MKFNLKVIGNIIGILLLINGLLMLTAVPFGIYHGEGSWKGILVASLVNSVIGFIPVSYTHLTLPTNREV